jgi:hypothetical protein
MINAGFSLFVAMMLGALLALLVLSLYDYGKEKGYHSETRAFGKTDYYIEYQDSNVINIRRLP